MSTTPSSTTVFRQRWIATKSRHDEYEICGDPAILEDVVAEYRQILTQLDRDPLAPENAALNRSDLLNSFARALIRAFERSGEIAIIDEAIHCCQSALHQESCRPDDRISLLITFASAIRSRCEPSASVERLDDALHACQEALDLCGPEHPERAAALNALGQTLRYQCTQRRSTETLDEAIKLIEEALRMAPASHPEHPLAEYNLGSCLMLRFLHNGMTVENDLDRAIDILSGPLRAWPSAHPNRYLVLHNLATANTIRYSRLNGEQELNDAVTFTQSVSPFVRSGIRTACTRFQISPSCSCIDIDSWELPADIDSCVELNREGLASLSTESPRRVVFLVNLAWAVRVRADHRENLTDLDEAVELYRDALSHIGTDHPHRPNTVAKLGVCLKTRFARRGHSNEADLNEAITLCREAVDIVRISGGNNSDYLTDLGGALLARFCHSTPPASADIEEAITLLEEAASDPTSGSKDINRAALSDAYVARFRYQHVAEDASSARALLKRCTETVPVGHTQLALYKFKLAALQLDATVPDQDLAAGVKLLLSALGDTHCPVDVRLREMIKLLPLLCRLPTSDPSFSVEDGVLNAYHAAVNLLPRVAYLGLHVASRLRSLASAQDLVMQGANYALSLARPTAALELLEEGRAVFWSHALRFRSPLAEIPSHSRDEILRISQQLERAGYGLDTGGPTDKAGQDAEIARRRQQSERLDELIRELRELPGLERFMLTDRFEKLSEAAAQGPVVVLMTGPQSSNAIVMEAPGKVKSLPLVGVTHDWLASSTRVWRTLTGRSRDALVDDERLGIKKAHAGKRGVQQEIQVLAELWRLVIEPIVHELGLKPVAGRARPRIWFCPTGVWSFLPLHAANDPLQSKSCSDYFVSSYTPTLGMLLNSRKSATPLPRKGARVLLNAVPVSPAGQYRSNLPHTVDELLAIRGIVPESALIPSPSWTHEDSESSGFSTEALLASLPQASILHLACHGYQDLRDPLNSGFIMRDGPLTIGQLMPIPLPRAFFAFLSACETAKGDTDQPDQTVHLAATMLFAGFKSVVATMWSMGDLDGPVVAKAVYSELFGNKSGFLDPDDIPYALDDVTQRLRRDGHQASRWAPFIHLGM